MSYLLTQAIKQIYLSFIFFVMNTPILLTAMEGHKQEKNIAVNIKKFLHNNKDNFGDLIVLGHTKHQKTLLNRHFIVKVIDTLHNLDYETLINCYYLKKINLKKMTAAQDSNHLIKIINDTINDEPLSGILHSQIDFSRPIALNSYQNIKQRQCSDKQCTLFACPLHNSCADLSIKNQIIICNVIRKVVVGLYFNIYLTKQRLHNDIGLHPNMKFYINQTFDLALARTQDKVSDHIRAFLHKNKDNFGDIISLEQAKHNKKHIDASFIHNIVSMMEGLGLFFSINYAFLDKINIHTVLNKREKDTVIQEINETVDSEPCPDILSPHAALNNTASLAQYKNIQTRQCSSQNCSVFSCLLEDSCPDLSMKNQFVVFNALRKFCIGFYFNETINPAAVTFALNSTFNLTSSST